MRPIAAIVETQYEQLAATVREVFSALRYSETQEEKLDARAKKSREDADKHERIAGEQREQTKLRRLELGRALVEIRKQWPGSGPRARGWGEFLAKEGLDERMARRCMELAGFVDEFPDTSGAVSENLPTFREVAGSRRERTIDDRDPKPENDEDSEQDDASAVEVIAPGAAIDIRLGDWRTTLVDVGMVDAVICDPPYGKRTHEAVTTRDDGSDPHGLTPDYEHWTADDVAGFVEHWSPRCRGWIAAMTSHDLIGAWESAFRADDRYVFAPVACVIRGMSFRRQGDGPSSWTVYLMCARPRNLSKWRSLPGAYVGPRVDGAKSGRGKPPWLMDRIIRDYSNAGDYICDPLAGFGVTLTSAIAMGRRAVGSELVDHVRREAIQRHHAGRSTGLTPIPDEIGEAVAA